MAEILSGGWYFATEVARVLDLPGVVTPEQGAAVLRGGARMSWQLTSFLILGVVLLGGFAWYERSRPPSQVVALVAALAALAIAGRIAFAAFPNVKPTTDIVIFAGYALGGAPGFAVGALAALVSNFWFGQGPWTPWQMAGWGLCGVLGAVLARSACRNAGRLSSRGYLRVCRHCLRRSAELLPDGDLRRGPVVEAVPRARGRGRFRSKSPTSTGNVALALIAGPAMVRMLVRFRERFEWRAGAVRTAGGGSRGPRRRPARRRRARRCSLVLCAVRRPLRAAAQRRSGQPRRPWLDLGPERPTAASPPRRPRLGRRNHRLGDARPRRRRPQPARRGQGRQVPVDFLALPPRRSQGRRRPRPHDPRAGGDRVRPAQFRRRNLVAAAARPAASRTAPTRAGRRPVPTRCWRCGRPAPTMTAAKTSNGCAACRARTAAGGTTGATRAPPRSPAPSCRCSRRAPNASDRALDYLRKAKRPNGGFAPGNNLAANAQATAWASQGLLAAGKDPASFGPGGSSLAYLRDLQAEDGHFLQAPDQEASPVWVTADVARPPRRRPPPDLGAAARTETEGEKVEDHPPGIQRRYPSERPAVAGRNRKASRKIPPVAGFRRWKHRRRRRRSLGGHALRWRWLRSAVDGWLPWRRCWRWKRPARDRSRHWAPKHPSGRGDASGEPASETTDSGSSTAGSIVLGLLAGCVLFLLGFAARRGWMRWRYGL